MSFIWRSAKFRRSLALFVGSVALFALYLHLYVYVFKLDLPRTLTLRRENAALKTRSSLLNRELDIYEADLAAMSLRDEDIYRSIFGLSSIPEAKRNAAFSVKEDYEYLDEADRSGGARDLFARADGLIYKAYVQSRSYDEIELMLSHADNMSSCIPAIYPILPDRSVFRISSPYGYRYHPLLKRRRMHTGIDFALPKGNGVYATGDGVVEEVKVEVRGYGRQVVINHGFGYKTRYAHLHSINVAQGQKLKRGQQIGLVGNTGKSTGPHLHYEVLFKNKPVDPMAFMDLSMKPEEYKAMVSSVNVQ